MRYSKKNEFEQNNQFRNDKSTFFGKYSSINVNSDSFSAINEDVKTKKHDFILPNRALLEAEFQHMFSVLQNLEKDEDNKVFWLYCYYCASLLEAYYSAYAQFENAKKYCQLKEKVKLYYNGQRTTLEIDKSFIESMRKSFADSFKNLVNTPYHTSDIRDYVSLSNAVRLYLVFSRLTLTQAFTLARDTKFIDKIDALLGTHTNVEGFLNILRAPILVFNYLSVGLFLSRFLIDFSMLLKHTFFPGEEEKKSDRMQRFKTEFYKRHWGFINDLTWATVNFVTNFNQVTKIPGPIAAYIVVAFLGFDVAMLFYKRFLDRKEYLLKKEQYIQEIKQHEEKLHLHTNKANFLNNPVTDDIKIIIKQEINHIKILNNQLNELELGWQKNEATLYFKVAAASLLTMGFTASIIVSSPLLIIAFYYSCLIGIAFYLSAGAYSEYKGKSLAMEQANLIKEKQELANKEYIIARNDFIFTLTKNTVVPIVLITTFAICWPAAVVLTALCIGYEAYHAYTQFAGKKEIEQQILNPQNLTL